MIAERTMLGKKPVCGCSHPVLFCGMERKTRIEVLRLFPVFDFVEEKDFFFGGNYVDLETQITVVSRKNFVSERN